MAISRENSRRVMISRDDSIRSWSTSKWFYISYGDVDLAKPWRMSFGLGWFPVIYQMGCFECYLRCFTRYIRFLILGIFHFRMFFERNQRCTACTNARISRCTRFRMKQSVFFLVLMSLDLWLLTLANARGCRLSAGQWERLHREVILDVLSV